MAHQRARQEPLDSKTRGRSNKWIGLFRELGSRYATDGVQVIHKRSPPRYRACDCFFARTKPNDLGQSLITMVGLGLERVNVFLCSFSARKERLVYRIEHLQIMIEGDLENLVIEQHILSQHDPPQVFLVPSLAQMCVYHGAL